MLTYSLSMSIICIVKKCTYFVIQMINIAEEIKIKALKFYKHFLHKLEVDKLYVVCNNDYL